MGDIELYRAAEVSNYLWKKYLPNNADMFYSDYSGIYFIKEISNGSEHYSTLDRIAQLAKNRKGIVSAYGRHFRLTKKDAERIADDLQQQAEKLIALASSYRILATAISLSSNNIEDIIISDPLYKKEMDNPF